MEANTNDFHFNEILRYLDKQEIEIATPENRESEYYSLRRLRIC